MSYEGMDVDQAQGLARQLDANAHALAAIAAAVTGLAGDLAYHWHGPVSADFERDWSARQRPALNAAAQALSDLHAKLVANIDQQITASAATASPPAEDGWTVDRIVGDAPGAWKWWEDKVKWPSIVDLPVGLLNDLGKDEYAAGTDASREYGKVWSEVMKLDHDSSFLKYHESPVLRSIHDASWVEKSQEILTKDHDVLVVADRVLIRTRLADLLGPIGMILAFPDAAVNTGEALNDLREGHYNSAIMHAGTVAEDEGGVVGLLGGYATRLFAEDYELGKQINWSQGVPNPLTGDNFRTEWLPDFGAAAQKAVGPALEALFG